MAKFIGSAVSPRLGTSVVLLDINGDRNLDIVIGSDDGAGAVHVIYGPIGPGFEQPIADVRDLEFRPAPASGETGVGVLAWPPP